MGPYQRPGVCVCSEYQGSGTRRGTRPLLLLLLFLPVVLATGYWLLATGSYWLVLCLCGVVARHCAACCISPTCFGFRRWAVPFCFSLLLLLLAAG
jgi:hypothetical protein